MSKKIFLFYTLLCGLGTASAQTATLDGEARQLYRHGHYTPAAQSLCEGVTGDGGTHGNRETRAEEADYLRLCTACHQGESDCLGRIEEFLLRYPHTPHANRLHAMAGNLLVRNGDYTQATDHYSQCDLTLLADDERDEATLCKAVALLKTDRTDEAYTLLTVVEMCSPEYETDARFHKAYIDYTRGRDSEALEAFATLESHPLYSDDANCCMADILLRRGSYDEAWAKALPLMEQAAQPAVSTEARRIAGEAAYGKGAYEEAVSLLTAYKAEAETPQRSALYKLGMSQYEQGMYTEAAANLTAVATEEDALTQNALLHSGLARLQVRDMTGARMALEQAAAMQYDRGVREQALFNYALCVHETSYAGFGESVTAFERFLNEFPDSPLAAQADEYLIEVYMSTRSYKTALASIARIKQPGTRIKEARGRILYRLGTEAFAGADYAGAIDHFTRSLQDGQYNRQTKADALFWRGEVRYRLGDCNGAAADYRQFLATETGRDDEAQRAAAYYNLGYTAFQQGQYTQARTYFERSIGMMQNSASAQQVSLKADALSRLGDCHFHARDFAAAERYYAEAAATDGGQGDYALYQKAFAMGLQKDYKGKVETLAGMLTAYPQSAYADDALYEQGRAYVQLGQDDRAIASFTELTTRYPESATARKAAGEIGLLHYRNDRYEQAIAAYKRVIEQYPGSEEARQAARDLKSVYIDLNRVDDYAAYADAHKETIRFNTDERDSLTYLAAEKAYVRGDKETAETALNAYLTSFPEGSFRQEAHYYLGMAAYAKGDTETAATHLDKVLEFPAGRFSEEAMTTAAELAFNRKDYARALTLYKALKGQTASGERLLLARTGILRAAHLTGEHDEVIAAAGELLADGKTAPELQNEARYYRSRALAAKNERELARKDLEELAKDTRNIYGAEAKYRLAELHYAAKDYAAAEKVLLDYIEVSTPHAYWLARSFVLLSDVYMQTGREVEAKQYLLSLKQNYQGEGNIATLIEERLSKL